MKVIVAGYPKTGTKTLKSALKILGYERIYDFEDHFSHHGKQWTKIFTLGGTKEDFYNMYKDVDATLDAPACVFWEDIFQAFPGAKVILTERDEDEWFQSLTNQHRKIRSSFFIRMLVFFSPTMYALRTFRDHLGLVAFCQQPHDFGGVLSIISKTVAVQRYRDHNSGVIMRAPKEQLLRFNVTEGWKPLCDFLGKAEPDKPFPHKNKLAEVVDEYLRTNPVLLKAIREMRISLAIIVVLVAAVIYFVFFR